MNFTINNWFDLIIYFIGCATLGWFSGSLIIILILLANKFKHWVNK